QYAYRRDRSALDAVKRVHQLIYAGHQEIVDADLSSYFDSIPHSELLNSVARRVVDGAMLHLIKMWLEAPVEETDEHGNKRRSTRNRDDGATRLVTALLRSDRKDHAGIDAICAGSTDLPVRKEQGKRGGLGRPTQSRHLAGFRCRLSRGPRLFPCCCGSVSRFACGCSRRWQFHL